MVCKRTLNVCAVENDPQQPMNDYLKKKNKSGKRFQHIVRGLKDNVKGAEKSIKVREDQKEYLQNLAKAAIELQRDA